MNALPQATKAGLFGPALRFVLVFVLLFQAAWGQAASSAATGHARAELLVHAPSGVKPGAEVWLGLRILHDPGWHTYWLNPGDSGLPTTMAWTLPAGVTAGAIAWPTPKQMPLGPLMNYGYDGELLLPVRLSVPASWQGGPLPVKLRADFLICEEACIPEFAELDTELTPGPASAHAALFERAFRTAPLAVPGLGASARIENNALVIEATGLPSAYRGRPLQLFPENGGVLEHPAPLAQEWQGEKLVLRAPCRRSAATARLRWTRSSRRTTRRRAYASASRSPGPGRKPAPQHRPPPNPPGRGCWCWPSPSSAAPS